MLRAVAAVLVIGACVATAAIAQDSAVPSEPTAVAAATFEPHFETPRHIGRYYPESAIEHGRSGLADICCSVRGDRSLDCRVAGEWPEGAGFGRGALRMAQYLKLTEASYADLQRRSTQSFELPVVWRLIPMSASAEAELSQAQQGWTARCGDGFALVEPITITGQVFR